MFRWSVLAAAALSAAAGSASAAVSIVNGGTYSTLADAVAAAKAGDELRVDVGTYLNDFVTVRVPLTIVGVGGIPVFQATTAIPNGKGIIVADASLTVRNLEFRGATVADGNGAGIRYEAGDLTVENSIFRGNQDGILTNSFAGGDLVVRGSQFIGNGAGDGYTHALYAGKIDTVTVENSTFSGTLVGHDIKSRAVTNTITGNTLDDGVSGTTSYAIDLPNGGAAVISKNTINQGVNTQNSIMVAYGAEGGIYAGSSLLVDHNTFTNTRSGSSYGVYNFSSIYANVVDNVFQGVATPLAGPGAVTTTTTTTKGHGKPPKKTATVFDLAAFGAETTFAALLDAPTEAPEPATLALLLTGAGVLLWSRRRASGRLPAA